MALTFSDRVRSRWWASIVLFAVGCLVAQGLVWIMINFIAFTALKAGGYDLSFDMRRLLMVIVQILIALVCLWMWIARGFQLSQNVNVRNISPLQKRLVALQLSEEADHEPNYLKAVEAVIEGEGVEVKDLTGGPA